MSGKPTGGELQRNVYEHGGSRIFTVSDDGSRNLICDTYQDGQADLFWEAANIHHETGLTPRQLADERERLESALQALAEAYATQGIASDKLLEEMAGALREFVELVDGVGEDELLALDSDPHPPSAFSVTADRARTALASYAARGK